jgi:hypothetical protein
MFLLFEDKFIAVCFLSFGVGMFDEQAIKNIAININNRTFFTIYSNFF